MKFLLSLFSVAVVFLSSSAFAQATSSGTAEAAPPADPLKGMLVQLPIFLALFALLYLGLIRPQKNQQKKQVEFLQKLSRGDEVVTAGGIIGKIVGLTDRVITLEVSEGTEVKVLKNQVQAYLKDSLPATT